MTETNFDPQSAPPPPQQNIRSSIVNVLEHTYGPWLVVLIFAVFLNLDPSVEVLIGFLLDWQNEAFAGNETTASVWAACLALVLLPLAAAAAAHVTLRFCRIVEPTARYLRAGLPIACLNGYGFAFVKVLRSPEVTALRATGQPELDLSLFWVLGLWLLIAVVVLIVYAAFFFLSTPLASLLNQFQQASNQDVLDRLAGRPVLYRVMRVVLWFKPVHSVRLDVMRGLWVIILAVVALLVVAAYVGFWAPELATRVGPVGMVASFGTISIIVLSGMTGLSSLMPGNTPIILLAVLLSIAVGSIGSAIGVTVVLIGALAIAWFTTKGRMPTAFFFFGGFGLLTCLYIFSFAQVPNCKTLAGCNMLSGVASEHSAHEKLPLAGGTGRIRVVAAQGGGLYAAYHTAYYLAHRADTEPGFAESLYAISGVSGGSVGAGVYWAVRTSGLCPTPTDAAITCHRDAVSKILEEDYLSPSLATLLFRDLFDTFIPVSALWHYLGRGPIDRGHVLEQEIKTQLEDWYETKVSNTTRQGTFQSPAQTLELSLPDSAYVGTSDGAAPAHPLLFFNSTQVDNGAKVVLSPVAIVNATPMALETATDTQLSVLNGMVISARFPLVTPPARVAIDPVDSKDNPHNTVQLVDGGYFDNSGIETAMDIILDLRKTTNREIELISFRATSPPKPAEIKGTVGAPLSAFLAAWRARSTHSEMRVDEVLGTGTPHCFAQIDTRVINFTLSWFLSRATFADVRRQIKRDPVCAPPPEQSHSG